MPNPLLKLAPSELTAVAAALRAGRLLEPYQETNLRRWVHASVAKDVAGALEEFEARPESIAHSLDLVAASKTESESHSIELVTTGPDAAGTANRDTSVVVRDLFHHAEHSVLVAGYAVRQGQQVFEALAQRMCDHPTLDVRFYLDISRKPGDTTAEAELVRRFVHGFRATQWPQGCSLPNMYYDPRALAMDPHRRAILHAKCVVVDAQDVLVSSANFTEAAQERNIEVGLLLQSPAIAEGIIRFFENLAIAGRFLRAA